MTGHHNGQALVELALILPVAMFLALGFLEAGLMLNTYAGQGRETGTLADWAGLHPESADWDAIAAARFPACGIGRVDDADAGLVTVTTTCTYHPIVAAGLWDGLTLVAESTAAIHPDASSATGAVP